MNVEEAIKAHALWKVRLTAYVTKPDGSLIPAEIARDDRCELGKWIHEEAGNHAHLPEFQELKGTHADFHRAAAGIVRMINAGTVRDIATVTGFASEFGVLSKKIVTELKQLAGKLRLAA